MPLRILAAVIQHRWVSVIFLSIAMSLATAAFFRNASLYEATARLMFFPDAPLLQTYSERYLHEWNILKSLSMHLDQIASEAVLQEVARSLDERVTVTQIRNKISITPLENDIIEIKFQHSSPALATAVPNAICKIYLERCRREIESLKDNQLKALDKSIQTIQNELFKKEMALQQFKEQHQIVSIDQQSEKLARNTSALEMALHKTKIDLQESRIQLAEVHSRSTRENRSETRLVENRDLVQERLSQVRLQLAEFSSRYGADHHTIVTLKRMLASLEKLEKEGHSIRTSQKITEINPIHGMLSTNESEFAFRISVLEAKLKSQEEMLLLSSDKLSGLPKIEQAFHKLLRETEVVDSKLRQLQFRRERIRINALVLEDDVRIFELADTAARDSMNNQWHISLVWLIGGIAGSILLVLALERIDTRIKDPEDIESKLGIQLLGMTERLEAAEMLVGSLGRSDFAAPESLNTLRAHLKHICKSKDIKVLLICSPLSGEGKTTIAAALALNYARDGKKTVLIDADLRRARVSKLFGFKGKAGMTEYLLGDIESDQLPLPTQMDGLQVIPAGSKPEMPAELFGVLRLNALLSSLRNNADMVIIDSPALLQASETIALSSKVDGCMLVLRWRKTFFNAALAATKQLMRIGCPIIGAVVNDVAREWEYRTYYGYYDYTEDKGKQPKSSRWKNTRAAG